ncbi:class E sortase [Planotetraspora silvatica]|uniref:Class E sortase n=1 Tax=Planotetraspora silvatica TaxID=234614 RepID=A0A8J3XJY6_9ACTN|nr:class E sortase [Planotetraspora silvatica]GII44722.1 class E sortase [Planotetraspora silvatica]
MVADQRATTGVVDDEFWEPPWRPVVRGAGEILITLGLLFCLFAAYEFYGRSWRIEAEQDQVDSVLDRQWKEPGSAVPVDGQPIARVHIPKLHRKWAVVEGVTTGDLRKGPGHYPGTARPGQVGNMAIAGHRIPSVFWDIDRLRDGDAIVAETKTGWYVYRVVGLRKVLPTQVEVIAPDPFHPGARPRTPMLTLTTCNPKLQNWQRLVVFAELDRAQARSQGRPAELEEAR